MYVNYVDCGTAVERTNEVNTSAFDASGIFRDVYIMILCKLCRLRTADCGLRTADRGCSRFKEGVGGRVF